MYGKIEINNGVLSEESMIRLVNKSYYSKQLKRLEKEISLDDLIYNEGIQPMALIEIFSCIGAIDLNSICEETGGESINTGDKHGDSYDMMSYLQSIEFDDLNLIRKHVKENYTHGY